MKKKSFFNNFLINIIIQNTNFSKRSIFFFIQLILMVIISETIEKLKNYLAKNTKNIIL